MPIARFTSLAVGAIRTYGDIKRMFNVTRTSSADGDVITLKGVIDEMVDLEKAIGPISGAAKLMCKEVTRINSMGIKNWCTYFGALRAKGIKLKFIECSPALVSQMSFLNGFIEPKEVVSVGAPYFCAKCSNEQLEMITIENAKTANTQPPVITCKNCGAKMEFDEDPDLYFGFAKD